MNEYARDKPMRILWVKVGGLWPVNTGGRLRSFHLLDELSRHHDISVLTSQQDDEVPGQLAQQLPRCRRVSSVPHVPIKRNSPRFVLALLRSWFSSLPVDLYKSRIPALQTAVTAALNSGRFDLCIADFLFAMPNVPLHGPVPVLFFAHNVEYMIWKRLYQTEPNLLRRALLAIEWRKLRRYEIAACAAADLTVAVSEADRALLGAAAGTKKIKAIATGVDTAYFHPDSAVAPVEDLLVFTGSMDWHPNEDAMLWFLEAILPLVRREIPGASLAIVGRNPGERLQQKARLAGVVVTGTVADVRPWMDQAAVYVVPLRIGGGTRLKIYEALAMGKAVVSTTIGAEGLPLVEDVHIIRADTAALFASRVIALLRDAARRRQMGEAGRYLMEQQFAWARVAATFEQHCRSLVTA